LTGSRNSGDAYVRAALVALLADTSAPKEDISPRVVLYHVFHRIWSSVAMHNDVVGINSHLLAIPPQTRAALLLTAMEEFSLEETCAILGRPAFDIQCDVLRAHRTVAMLRLPLSAPVASQAATSAVQRRRCAIRARPTRAA